MPLPLLSSYISHLKEAAFASHFTFLLPACATAIHLNQTGSLSCSCPHSNGLPPEWQLEHYPSTALDTENTAQPWQCMADSADTESTVLLHFVNCIQIDLLKTWPYAKATKLKIKKTEHLLACETHDLTGNTVLPAICLHFLFVQIPATATNTGSTDPLLLQDFRTAHSPQVTRTCKGKQKP